MIPSMASYFELPDYAEMTEADFEQYADEVVDHVSEQADKYGPPMTAEEWEYVHGSAWAAIADGDFCKGWEGFDLPAHLQPDNWQPPEPDPDAKKMHALGL